MMNGVVTSKITLERTEEKKAKGYGGKRGYSKENKFVFRVTEEDYKKCREIAFINDISVTEVARRILSEALSSYQLKLLG